MDKRSVHGGKDSRLEVEVSAVRGFASDNIATCNGDPDKAEAFAVYIRNPLAMHIQDFGPDTTDPEKRVSMMAARAAAFTYADALADHLGCPVHSHLTRPWTFAQFQASGRDCPDLGEAGVDDCEGMPGRLYGAEEGELYIEREGDVFWLTIANETRMGALQELERILYDWALDEGHLDEAPAVASANAN